MGAGIQPTAKPQHYIIIQSMVFYSTHKIVSAETLLNVLQKAGLGQCFKAWILDPDCLDSGAQFWAGSLTSLYFSFPTCKVGITVLTDRGGIRTKQAFADKALAYS